MKRNLLIGMALAAGTFWLVSTAALAQLKPAPKKEMTPPEIIKEFTTRESELFEIWKEYSYKQESRLERLGPAKTVTGDFYQVSEFVFNDAGKRIQRILKAPPSILEAQGILTQEDKNALFNLQPFALTAEELPNYNLSYVGKEKVDDLDTYVFDVNPKVMGDQRALKRLKDQKVEGRYFQGRIWVDDQDLQVVKVAGKVVPEFKQRFPKFETYRENIDGRYWFPTYTFGEDRLYFDDGGDLHIRMVVKYKDYRRFQSDVKITTIDEEVPDPNKPAENTGKAPAQTPPAGQPTTGAKPAENTGQAPAQTTPAGQPTTGAKPAENTEQAPAQTLPTGQPTTGAKPAENTGRAPAQTPPVGQSTTGAKPANKPAEKKPKPTPKPAPRKRP